ncbi:3-hydroxyacyl-CoA dehydrogenase [Aquipuribacter nitratireducens]|uniref:3-hydroxyacyl-CoA dehydrogenase n=1 Tax=Aquipuribacter nitratireducens TaxID=650104 RepID=A0ABW0GS43_9MICO
MTSETTTRTVVGVVGAGTMGAGIAHVAAAAGHDTLLLDARDGAAAAAVEQVGRRVRRSVEKGRLDEADAEALLARLRPAADLTDLAGCGLVVEAVVEDPAVKQELLRELAGVVAADTLLATNTSSLSVGAIATALPRPGRVLGLHFFNPAPLMRLVEVVRAPSTDQAAVDAAVALVAAWGKTPVVCADTPGFVVNRVARPYYGEAFRLLADPVGGLDPATVDALLTGAGGFPMGPCALTDLIGQDVNAAVNRAVWEGFDRDPRFTPSVVQDALVAAGTLGRKSGRGFLDHTEGADAPQPATVEPCTGPALRPGRGLDPLARRAGWHDQGEEPGSVEVVPTDGRTAAAVEAALGRPVVVLDAVRDPATATRVGAVASPACPPGALAALAAALAPAGVAVSPLPDVPGLVVARTAAALVAAAEDAVESGVTDRAGVDRAMELGAGHPAGPLAWGRDLGDRWVVGVLDALHAAEPTGRYRVPATLRARAMLAADRVSRGLGIGLVAAGPGHGTVRATVTETWLNGFGIVHGGLVAVLADTALAVACNSHGPLTVGAGLDVVWVSPGRTGDVLVAEARERVRYGAGARNGVYDITVRRDDGSGTGDVVAEVRGRTRSVGPVPAPSPDSPPQEDT